ncbi:MAG: glycoside hydrolase family 5 protein [Prolixibacteraceae bacterium]|nr:glycoside hydrolase family 5 protein [Prolixibacteraceae bacterium]
MRNRLLYVVFFLVIVIQSVDVRAWEGMPMPELHVEGRYLKDSHGHVVNLHGFAQTFSPWFNEQGSKWSNYDVQGCLNYNKTIIDRIMDAGWKVNFVRQHMDPYWSSTPGCTGRYEGEECFNETRFRKYLDEVFVPMAEYAVSKGLYVVMRPPGVSPETIEIGGVYHEYLIRVWSIVSNHPVLKNHPHIMFELANEPIDILGPDGTYGAGTQGHFDNLKTYFQEIVNTIRSVADNIIWVPGLGYQSLYSGYAVNPIEGDNIGYAVHVYPGWFNSGQGYEPFQRGWDNQVQPVADFAPVIVTEMDWAPERHNKSWGKATTGTAGGEGFGANFKKIADDCGNVSWLIFTSPDLLAEFGNPDAPADIVDFLTDPEACPWPVYHWYRDYAEVYDFNGVSEEYLTLAELYAESGENISVLTNSSKALKINAVFADGHIENVASLADVTVDRPDVVQVLRGRVFALADGQATVNVAYTGPKGNREQLTLKVSASTFPLTTELFNPGIWENGTFDEDTKTLHTGPWGFGGWQYNGIDLSGYKYLVSRLGSANNASADFRIFDGASYWGSPAIYRFNANREIVVVLNDAVKDDGSPLDPEHIYIAGFWSNGNNPFVIDTVFLTNSSEYAPPGIYVSDVNERKITALDGLNYVIESGPSESQSFVVSGFKLEDDITIHAPENFEISTDAVGEYVYNIILPENEGTVNETIIFVRLKSGLIRDTYSGDIQIESTGVTSIRLSLSGMVDFKTNVKSIDKADLSVISTSYFSISGRRVYDIENARGLFIKRDLMSDGSLQTSKIIKY